MRTSNTQGKVLGILKPVGGGDEIPLMKPEIIIGRRRSCDICLDFNNISGRHCQLRLINSVWHVRDLGSTNGTSLNGNALANEHNILPDDELAIASHLFTLDYEPAGPDAILHSQDMLEEVGQDGPKRHSLLELAGIEDDAKPRPRRSAPRKVQQEHAPGDETTEFGDADEEFLDDVPAEFQAGPAPRAVADDDDFLKLIEEDVKKAGDKREK
jgi:hypothetical protein